MKSLIAENKTDEAHEVYGGRSFDDIPYFINSRTQAWSWELRTWENATGCTYIYDMTQCETDPEEENYEAYAMFNSTRAAIHVGNREDNLNDFIAITQLLNQIKNKSWMQLQFSQIV